MDEALGNKFDQILKHATEGERFEDENQVTPYLRIVTGYRYNVEITSHRRWGSNESPLEAGQFFQIIPDKVDNGFFDWYCDNRPHQQNFNTVEMALLHFIFYWHIWKEDLEEKSKI